MRSETSTLGVCNKTSILGVKKLISLAFALVLIIPNITLANPFDVFNNYYPDFLISNVWQDNSSKDIYVKVCNIGWSADAWTMLLWLKKSNWEKFTKTFQNVNIYAGGCVDYRTFSPSEISIGDSGDYILTLWIIIKSSKSEKNLANNITSRNVYINAPVSYLNTNYNYPYYNNNSNYYYNSNNCSYYNNYHKNYYYGYNPDIEVNSIIQNPDFRSITIKICNKWASMINNQNLSTRVSVINWQYIIRNNSINLAQNSCMDLIVNYFELWIYFNNYLYYYQIKVDTDIYNNIYETNKDNNSLTRGFNY